MSVRDKIVLLSALIVIVGGALIINGRFNAKNTGLHTASAPAVNMPNSKTKELSIKDTDAFRDARAAISIIKGINEPVVAANTPLPQAPVKETPPIVAQSVKPNPIINEAAAAVRATVEIPQTQVTAAAVTPTAAASAAVAVAASTGNVYTVQKGQTLIDISLAVYKDKANAIANARKIYEYNKDQLASIDKIKIGQKLRIPSIEDPKQAQSKLKVIADSMQDKTKFMSSQYVPAPKTKSYTVKKGDNLWSIAQNTLGNGSRYKEIVAINNGKLTNNNKLSPGMTIVIPN